MNANLWLPTDGPGPSHWTLELTLGFRYHLEIVLGWRNYQESTAGRMRSTKALPGDDES